MAPQGVVRPAVAGAAMGAPLAGIAVHPVTDMPSTTTATATAAITEQGAIVMCIKPYSNRKCLFWPLGCELSRENGAPKPKNGAGLETTQIAESLRL